MSNSKYEGSDRWHYFYIISEGKLIHGERYNYSKLVPHGNYTSRTILDLTCNGCKNSYKPIAYNFIVLKRNCRCWSNRALWSYERVIKEGPEIHGDKYDYIRLNPHGKYTSVTILELICKNCKEIYRPNINNFMIQGNDCRCYSNKVLWTYGRIIKEGPEIHGDKYDYIRLDPHREYTAYTILDLICKKCRNIYMPTIDTFMNAKCNCRCYTNSGVSKISLEWLSYRSVIDNTFIQHAGNGKEYTIPGTRYRADGFSSPITIYEFYGDFYHGNPDRYTRDHLNKQLNVTMGELHDKTMARESLLISMGYKLITIWEKEWREIRNGIQGAFKVADEEVICEEEYNENDLCRELEKNPDLLPNNIITLKYNKIPTV